VPAPVERKASRPTRIGAIYYGSTAPSMDEAIVALEAQDLPVDLLRVRAFPFADAVAEFIESHDLVFVVEQNRDAQLRTLLVNELDVDPARLMRILHFDGTPITARFITRTIGEQVRLLAGKPGLLPGGTR
jgi:2-oxoglutarate ferredoxin oxidoreductase subunit alpha